MPTVKVIAEMKAAAFIRLDGEESLTQPQQRDHFKDHRLRKAAQAVQSEKAVYIQKFLFIIV